VRHIQQEALQKKKKIEQRKGNLGKALYLNQCYNRDTDPGILNFLSTWNGLTLI
jgi:hypothetical protein